MSKEAKQLKGPLLCFLVCGISTRCFHAHVSFSVLQECIVPAKFLLQCKGSTLRSRVISLYFLARSQCIFNYVID